MTDAHPQAPRDAIIMQWQKAIRTLRPGLDEMKLTGEDWAAIENFVIAPF